MNRRGFLQSISAAIAAVSLPVTAGVGTVTPIVNAGGRFEFFGPEYFDFGHQVGLGIKLPDGRRHAVRTLRSRGGQAKHFKGYDPLREQSLLAEDVTHLKRALLDWAERQYRKAA